MAKEKQEGPRQETAAAYAAFLEFCKLGLSRSLRKVAQVLLDEKSRQNAAKTPPKLENILHQVKEWSAQHNWQERVKEYDRELLQMYNTKALAALVNHLDAHVEVTAASQIKAAQLILERSDREGRIAELEEQLALTNAALEKAGIIVDAHASTDRESN